MEDIPLKVLIIDPISNTAEGLRRALDGIEIVLSVDYVPSLNQANDVIDRKDVNAIYIDPISLGLDPASDFIFSVRRSNPGIVFVLYYDFRSEKKIGGTFYTGERRRFVEYFKLDKQTLGPDFIRMVIDTIRSCQSDLAYSLTKKKITSLKGELASIQADASNGSAVVPIKILKDIQEMLTTRQEKTEVADVIYKPAEFLGPLTSSVKNDRCFVIMPYSETWSKGVEAVLKESCDAASFEFTIAKTMDGRFVARDIWQGITGSAVIVADLTGANANVTYEVGLADAVGREVVLICQDSKVPFDFLGHRLIVYENSVAGALTLRQKLTERLKKIRGGHV